MDTPLRLACHHNCLEIAGLFIDAGADVNEQHTGGWTPLHSVCVYGYESMVQFLINAGANVHLKDKMGWTPLHNVCYHNHTTIVRLLIRAGADWLVVNDYNKTPVDHVIEEQSNGVLVFLETIADQLPDSERNKIQAWRFRQELKKPVELTGFFIYNHI